MQHLYVLIYRCLKNSFLFLYFMHFLIDAFCSSPAYKTSMCYCVINDRDVDFLFGKLNFFGN